MSNAAEWKVNVHVYHKQLENITYIIYLTADENCKWLRNIVCNNLGKIMTPY